MSSRRLGVDALKKAEGRFAITFPQNKPVKFFIDSLYTALNTGINRDIQRCKIWIVDIILPSEERIRALLVFSMTLCRDMSPGLLTTAATRGQQVSAPPGPTAQEKRLRILYVLCDVAATLSLSLFDRHYKPLPNVHRQAREQLKIFIVILSQLAACDAEGPHPAIVTSVLPACVKRGLITTQESTTIQAQMKACTGEDSVQIMEQLQEEHDIVIEEESILDEEIIVDRILPCNHGVFNDTAAPWDMLPAANGLYLKQTRGFPLRAGALRDGIYLQNSGKQSSEQIQDAVKRAHKIGKVVSRRYTKSTDVANIDGMANIVMKDAEVPTINYASIALNDIPKIRALRDHFRSEAVGYSGVPKLSRRLKNTPGIRSDIERAISLARGDARGGHSSGRSFRGGFRGNGRGGFNNGGDYRGGGRS